MRNPLSFCLVRFLFGSLILHQNERRFLIFLDILETCSQQHIENNVVVDKNGGNSKNKLFVDKVRKKRYNQIKFLKSVEGGESD